jgi:hypothetical protein
MGTRIAIAVSLLLAGCGEGMPEDRAREARPDEAARAAFEDPDVGRVWARMMDRVAPDRGWERARYLEFDWAVRRAEDDALVRRHRRGVGRPLLLRVVPSSSVHARDFYRSRGLRNGTREI